MTPGHTLQSRDLLQELIFVTSRSSGPGGQNVNKVNSRVTLKWHVVHSPTLNGEQKELILKKLAARITKEGVLMISAQDSRSQLENKDEVLSKLDQLLTRVFAVTKKRKPTKPSKSGKQARLKSKKHTSEKKQWRQKL